MWGSDLSGTIQGAGGVGGLLEVIYKGAQTTNCFVAFDGNGNVAALADAGSGSVLAQYEYGPFGEVLRASGPMAKANPFRFSTKYQDDETDLLYYGYRYYNASTGRWNSRDPLGDEAFQEVANIVKLPAQESYGNDYLFVHNSTLSTHDFLGLCDVTTSGSGSVSGGLGTVIIHHPFPGIHTHYPPVTDTFTLQCPASKPYLAIWGLSSSTYSPWYDSFPSGWGGSVSGGPVTYMVTIQVPSSTTVFMRRSQLAGLYVRGCCVCQSPGSIGRIDPPAPPPFPDDPYPYN
jgi:RHS repeat-associated protein